MLTVPMTAAATGDADVSAQQPQLSPRQDSVPSHTDAAAMPRPMTGSSHQSPGQAAVMAEAEQDRAGLGAA